jgi:hypothetical protein
MDYRSRNLPTKRIFGKDITNIERRTKNNSISEKPTVFSELRNKSKSYSNKPAIEMKDPITEY